ncbi:hypothetical protein [Streptomyces leeuwenhoekii]|uniref:Sle1_042 protein n=1 Tax=Streptomyces leeuwenhoekii TaxID=1437453 RepID=A0A0F7VKJ4_STRLW|nr:hypothetical protein [Streptomyces leeuwenhoekii]CQR59209.1 sle1_042 [Streptomyces leeuwenhoekii]
MTTAPARRIPGQPVNVHAPAPGVGRETSRVPCRLPGQARREWPRPPLIHDHARLFVEPTYLDGQPYSADDKDDTGE